MNEWSHALFLAMLQGFTEFLPISSAGHLALVPWIFGWKDQGLTFDVSVHIGSLVAVIFYFRKDLYLLTRSWLNSIFFSQNTRYSKLAWSMIFTTTLVGAMGLYFERQINDTLRHPIPIAIATIIFGICLWLSDTFGLKKRMFYTISWIDVVLVGTAQGIALIPGASRSGITMSIGLIIGLTREAAARLSFLISIPIMFLAGWWRIFGVANHVDKKNWIIFTFSSIVSAVVAFICIHYLLRFVNRFSLMPFVIYRIIFGIVLLSVYIYQ